MQVTKKGRNYGFRYVETKVEDIDIYKKYVEINIAKTEKFRDARLFILLFNEYETELNLEEMKREYFENKISSNLSQAGYYITSQYRSYLEAYREGFREGYDENYNDYYIGYNNASKIGEYQEMSEGYEFLNEINIGNRGNAHDNGYIIGLETIYYEGFKDGYFETYNKKYEINKLKKYEEFIMFIEMIKSSINEYDKTVNRIKKELMSCINQKEYNEQYVSELIRENNTKVKLLEFKILEYDFEKVKKYINITNMVRPERLKMTEMEKSKEKFSVSKSVLNDVVSLFNSFMGCVMWYDKDSQIIEYLKNRNFQYFKDTFSVFREQKEVFDRIINSYRRDDCNVFYVYIEDVTKEETELENRIIISMFVYVVPEIQTEVHFHIVKNLEYNIKIFINRIPDLNNSSILLHGYAALVFKERFQSLSWYTSPLEKMSDLLVKFKLKHESRVHKNIAEWEGIFKNYRKCVTPLLFGMTPISVSYKIDIDSSIEVFNDLINETQL